MTDQPFDTSNGQPPRRQPKPGERLLEFLRGPDRFLCELRDYARYGVEAQFFQNERFRHSRRFVTRALAVQWAEDQRTIIEKEVPLEAGDLLHCPHCYTWHPLIEDSRVAHAHEPATLCFQCGAKRYFAGTVGGTARHPTKKGGP